MPFSKLSSDLTHSSLWNEDYATRIVFISFLSLKDETGFVTGARTSLQRICNVSLKEFDTAIEALSSPDPESKSKEFGGRRIEKIDGGYIVLNHEKYRLPENKKKEKHREYMKEWRKKKDCESHVNSREFTKNHKRSRSVSVSVSDSVSRSINNVSTNLDTSNTGKMITRHQIEEIYRLYPRKVGKGAALKKIEIALKKVSFNELFDKVKLYAESVKHKEIQFIPHPATWFNQERWNDPIEEYKPPSKKRQKNEYEYNRKIPILDFSGDKE